MLFSSQNKGNLEAREHRTNSPSPELVHHRSNKLAPMKLQPSHMPTVESTSSLREWTDEKHRLYLKSMEASFVNRYLNPSNSPRSGQFNVLRGGLWTTVSSERVNWVNKYCRHRHRAHEHADNQSSTSTTTPWIHHFRSSPCKHDNDDVKAIDSATNHVDEKYDVFLNVVEEVSDQNFVNGVDREQEISSVRRAKRIRITDDHQYVTNGHDQVVPSSN